MVKIPIQDQDIFDFEIMENPFASFKKLIATKVTDLEKRLLMIEVPTPKNATSLSKPMDTNNGRHRLRTSDD